MNATVSSAVLPRKVNNEVVQYADGSVDFCVSTQLSCHYEHTTKVLWSKWAPRGIPSFNLELLRDLERASQLIEAHFRDGLSEKRALSYLVLRSNARGTFNVGGDLGHFHQLITAQDRPRLTEYARAAIEAIYRNYTSHNVPGVTTVALLEGDALGGGLECALSCDVVIAERHVKCGFPEVLFGMFPGMGGMSFLTRRVTRRVADEMVRSGRQYTAQELHELGIIDVVVDTGKGTQAVRQLVQQREHHQIAHIALNAVDRLVRPISIQELHSVVQLWVDCAMQMSPRGLEWMHRLYQRQLAIFGRPLELATVRRDPVDSDVAVAA